MVHARDLGEVVAHAIEALLLIAVTEDRLWAPFLSTQRANCLDAIFWTLHTGLDVHEVFSLSWSISRALEVAAAAVLPQERPARPVAGAALCGLGGLRVFFTRKRPELRRDGSV